MKLKDKTQKIGVTAFIFHDNKVLILKRSKREKFLPGYCELPGGKIKFAETAERALKREIKEETNLNIRIIKPYYLFSYLSEDNKRQTIDIQFIVKLTGGIKNLKLSKEHDEYKFISRSELKKYKMTAAMRKIILKGFNEIKNR